MIVEGVVLLRVEHLEQRRRRVAAEVGRHLVDLVEQEDGVVRARLAQALDDLAGHRADVRAAVAADLGLVAHAAERQAHELAPGRARDALPSEVLPTPGGPTKQRTGPLIFRQRLHREVLEDALLDLFEAVVILFEDPLGLLEVELLLGLLVPGQREDPVDVVAHDGRLGAHRVHHLELLELPLAFSRASAASSSWSFSSSSWISFLNSSRSPQLLLDRLHLLVEVVLLLRLLHLLLDAGPDPLLDLEDLDLGLHQPRTFEALGRIGDLEQRLPVVELDAADGDDRVGQARRVVDRRDRSPPRAESSCSA